MHVASKIIITICTLFAMNAMMMAMEMEVSVEEQVETLKKIIAQDRNLPDSEIAIGLLNFPDDTRLTADQKANIVQAFKGLEASAIAGRSVRVMQIDYTSIADLKQTISSNGVHVLYILPANASRVSPITTVSPELGTLTVSGMLEYLTKYVSIAIAKAGDSNRIFLNLEQSKKEGANFPATFIKITQLTSPG